MSVTVTVNGVSGASVVATNGDTISAAVTKNAVISVTASPAAAPGATGPQGPAGTGSAYTLIPATSSTLGGVKAGANVTVAGDGTISVAAPVTTLAAGSITGLATVATSGSYADLSNKPTIPSAYSLPVATASVLGGVKAGANVTIAADGTISAASTGSSGGDDPRWEYFKPAAPAGVTATADNAQAVVSWTAPAVVVPPLTDYSVQFKANSATTWEPFTDAVSTATSATVTGLTNGAAYVFRVAGINAIGTGAYSSESSAVTPGVPTDPFFSNVALLLHMNGTGAAFIDSSGTPKTITASGSVTQSTTESKFGGKSAYFSTSSDALSFADLGIGTGDFAIELFMKTASNVQYAQIIGNETSGSTAGFSLLINNNAAEGGQIALYRGGAIVTSSAFTDFSDDAWHHIAVSRSGTSVRLYVDGTLLATATSAASFTSSANTYVARNNVFTPRNVSGYIDELRITVGSARGYTGSTISVPTAAFLDA